MKNNETRPPHAPIARYNKPVVVDRGNIRQNTEANPGPESEESVIWMDPFTSHVQPRE